MHENQYQQLLDRVAQLELAQDINAAPDTKKSLEEKHAAEEKRETDALKDRLDMAEKMFKTIMEVDLHLDNKAQRILGALAFITTATTFVFGQAYRPVLVRTSVKEAKLSELSPGANAAQPAPTITVDETHIAPPSAGKDIRSRLNTALTDAPTQLSQSRFRQFRGFATPLFFFWGYMVCMVTSAALYFAALGPTFNLRLSPRPEPAPPKTLERVLFDPESPGDDEAATHRDSLLFFRSIAAMDKTRLLQHWDVENPTVPVTELRKRMLENYVSEAQIVAQKAVAKFRWMSVGSILVRVALVFLGLIVASMTADVDKQFLPMASWILAALFASFAFEMRHRPSEHGKIASNSLAVAWTVAAATAFTVGAGAMFWNWNPF